MTTLGDILDLIDNNRESDEVISIMNCNGESEMTGMVCSKLWEGVEARTVNSIMADGDMFKIWLNDD